MPPGGKRPQKVKPSTPKEPGTGEKQKDKGGDKVSPNIGTNPAGGIINVNTENNGENTGPVVPISIGGDGDKGDPITGGIQGKFSKTKGPVILSFWERDGRYFGGATKWDLLTESGKIARHILKRGCIGGKLS